MGIPEPPKRRDRRALRYLDELKARALADPTLPVHDEVSATLYVWALVVAAFFGEKERRLFRQVYEAYTEGECLYEMRAACACEDKDPLCLILDQIMAETSDSQLLAAYLMQAIESESWRSVQQDLKDRKLTADNFVWWSFDPDQRI